jgi:hypothetical protein
MEKSTQCMHGRAYWSQGGCVVRSMHSESKSVYEFTFASEAEAQQAVESRGPYSTWGASAFTDAHDGGRGPRPLRVEKVS